MARSIRQEPAARRTGPVPATESRADARRPADVPGRASTSRQVARGTLQLLSGQIAARLIDFALYLILARSLPVEGFGLFTFALSFVLLFNVVADLGVSTVMTREVSRAPDRARALVGHALVLKAGGGALAVVAILAAALALGTRGEAFVLVAVCGASLAARSTTLVFEGLLKATGRAGAVGTATFAGSLVGLATAGALLAAGIGPLAAAIAWGTGGLVHLSLSAWLARRLYARTPGAEAGAPGAGTVRAPGGAPARALAAPPVLGRHAMLREALPLALSWVFIALYFRIDAVMLQFLSGERAVGLYGGIYRIFEAFTMLAVAYRSVLFPVMARAADGPREALAVLCRKSIRLHLVFTIAVAVFVSFNARALVTLVLGQRYADAAPGLAILVWALPGSFMADTLLHLLIAQRRQKLGTTAVSVTAALNIALNVVLIPKYSFVGAAAATVASEALCFVLLLGLFRRGAPAVGVARTVWRPLAAGGALAAAMAALTPLVPSGPAGLAVGGAAAAAVYLAALVALGALTRDDLVLARSIFKREA